MFHIHKTLRLSILLVLGIFGIPSVHARDPQTWEKEIIEIFGKYFPEALNPKPLGEIDVLPNPLDYWRQPKISQLSSAGLDAYLEAKFRSVMTTDQKRAAKDLLVRALQTDFQPEITDQHYQGASRQNNVNIVNGEIYNPKATFPTIEGFSPPYFFLARHPHGGNNSIVLMMDSKGKALVLKKMSYAEDSNLTQEGKILDKAKELGHPNFVRNLAPDSRDRFNGFREYLEVFSNAYEITDHLFERAKNAPDVLSDLKRMQQALFGLADDLAHSGIGLPFPDFSLTEVLIVREGNSLRVKLTDLEHSTLASPSVLLERNRDVMQKQFQRAAARDPRTQKLLGTYSQPRLGDFRPSTLAFFCDRALQLLKTTAGRFRKTH